MQYLLERVKELTEAHDRDQARCAALESTCRRLQVENEVYRTFLTGAKKRTTPLG